MTLEEMEKYRGMLMQAYSADLYDVLDKMGYSNQCLDLGISPLNPLWKIAGPAFTIWGTLMSSPRQKNIYFFLSPRSSFLDRNFAASRFCSAAKNA